MDKIIKKTILILMVVVLALTVAGCKKAPLSGPDPDPSSTPVQSEAPESSSSPSSPDTSPAITPDTGNTDDDVPEQIGPLEVFHSVYYYLDGDESAPGFCFHELGSVDIAITSGEQEGTYYIDEDEITITLNDDVIAQLRIMNMAELRDIETDDTYALPGALDMNLHVGKYYYQNANVNAVGIHFREDGELDYEVTGQVLSTAAYTVEGTTILTSIGSDAEEIYIINSYTLRAQDGIVFIREP